jgi:hypothetical protein
MSKVTSLRVTKQTRNRLSEIGSKRETYDKIIQRLIDFYNNNSEVAQLTRHRRRLEEKNRGDDQRHGPVPGRSQGVD